MTTALSDEEILKLARARVAWRMHALTYVGVNVLLNVIWFLTSSDDSMMRGGPGFYWPIWPALGWGVGLAIHGFTVFGSGRDWEAREVEKLRQRYGGQR